MTPIIVRAREGRTVRRGDEDRSREPVRQSLTRYYAARTDPTRTRGARRETIARRQARAMKASA